MHIFQMVALFNREHKKLTFVTINVCLTRKVFRCWKAVKLMVLNASFPKFLVLPLEAGIFFILVADLLGVFLEAIG